MAEMPDSPLTCLDLWCRAGSSVEEKGEEGLAHLLEHMVFKGSKTLGPGEFDLRIEALGGSSNAATGFDDVHFHVLVPPLEVESALSLLLDLVLAPSLQEKEFYTERDVVLEEIAQYRDQPDEKVFQKLMKNCWGNHPYGRPILGYEESLNSINTKTIRSFHERLYTGRNCCLSIAGALPRDLENLIRNSLLSELPINSQDELMKSDLKEDVFQPGRIEVEIPRLESGRLMMAWQIPSANEQIKIMGADIATTLLSEGRRSRLVQRLREDLQIVESIDMDVTVLEQRSMVLLEACCLEENLEVVEKEINQLLQESLETTPNIAETERAHQLVRNGLYFSLECSSQVAGLAGAQTLWNRYQSLLEPLKYIDYWNPSRLKEEIFPLLQSQTSFILVARPQEVN